MARPKLREEKNAVLKDSRKRKRGPLQDISNKENKEKDSQTSASTSLKSSRTKSAKTSGKEAVTSRVATRGSASSTLGPRTGRRLCPSAKKNENQSNNNPPEKKSRAVRKQTSILAYHEKNSSRVTRRITRQSTDGALDDVSNASNSDDNIASAASKQALNSENISAQTEKEHREPVPVKIKTWSPKPFVFKYNHLNSGFYKDAYASLVDDIDKKHERSLVYCPKIAREMDIYHRKHEEKYHPKPTYLTTIQTDINEKMRSILVDWLVEVGEEYNLDIRTLHKGVNLVDRALMKLKIQRKEFQLLGCACMLIASKYEEVYGPNVEDFVYISDQTYTPEQMLEMEIRILEALEYRISSTTCYHFISRFSKAGKMPDEHRYLVIYLCELSLLSYQMLKYKPSQIAASAVYLARVIFDEKPWTPTLHHYSKYNPWELKSCVMELYRIHAAECKILVTNRENAKAVSEKYYSDRFEYASASPSPPLQKLETSFHCFLR